jgi:hypothetical protein
MQSHAGGFLPLPTVMPLPQTQYLSAQHGNQSHSMTQSFADSFASVDSQHTNTKLMVNHIPLEVTESVLRDMFQEFGPLETARLVVDRNTGMPKGYGFVTFQNAVDAERAKIAMHGFRMYGKTLRVAYPSEPSHAPRRHPGVNAAHSPLAQDPNRYRGQPIIAGAGTSHSSSPQMHQPGETSLSLSTSQQHGASAYAAGYGTRFSPHPQVQHNQMYGQYVQIGPHFANVAHGQPISCPPPPMYHPSSGCIPNAPQPPQWNAGLPSFDPASA